MIKTGISSKRIEDRLEAIYRCGEKPDGTYARIAFSSEYRRGRDLFADYCRGFGIEPREDAAGNLVARYEGLDQDAAAIVIGSHLDTVANGGRYDGAYGCVAGLEILEALSIAGVRLHHPVELVVFMDEEGVRFGNGLFGSTAFSGGGLNGFDPADLDADDLSRAAVMTAWGIDVDRAAQAGRPPESILAFLELHVEQGRVLDRRGLFVGIVSSIAGVLRDEIEIRGESNHAGSTMMPDRKDALVPAAACIAGLPELVAGSGSEYAVATVGRIHVFPNEINVVPGCCRFNLEIRDQNSSVIDRIREAFYSGLEQAASAGGLSVEKKNLSRQAPSAMAAWIQDEIASACAICGQEAMSLPSGAFHDALPMSARFPTGMIFVPSCGGISHSPLEATDASALDAGCQVLLQTVLNIDKRKGVSHESI